LASGMYYVLLQDRDKLLIGIQKITIAYW
jgi:hypothetical protein